MQFCKNSGFKRLLAASMSMIMLTGALPGIAADFATIPIVASAEESDIGTIDVNNGSVVFTPTGYTQAGKTTPYKGNYVIRGSYFGTNPLTFQNNTGKPVTFNVTFENDNNSSMSIVASNKEANAVTLNGNSDITLNIVNKCSDASLVGTKYGFYSNTYAKVNITNKGSNVFSIEKYDLPFTHTIGNFEWCNDQFVDLIIDGDRYDSNGNVTNSRYIAKDTNIIQSVKINNENIQIENDKYIIPAGTDKVTVTTNCRAKFNNKEYECKSKTEKPPVIDEGGNTALTTYYYEYEVPANKNYTVTSALVYHRFIDPTCTKEGNNSYYSYGDNEFYKDLYGNTAISKDSVIVEKISHTLFPTVETTSCETVGLKAGYWKCRDCGKYFADDEGKQEVSKTEVLIPSSNKSHEFDENGFCKNCTT